MGSDVSGALVWIGRSHGGRPLDTSGGSATRFQQCGECRYVRVSGSDHVEGRDWTGMGPMAVRGHVRFGFVGGSGHAPAQAGPLRGVAYSRDRVDVDSARAADRGGHVSPH